MASCNQKLTEEEKKIYRGWTWGIFNTYCQELLNRHPRTDKELNKILAIQEYIKEKKSLISIRSGMFVNSS